MDPKDIRAMSDEELAESLENARQEVFNLRIQHAIGQLADTSRMAQVRHDIARMLTVKREREIWAAFQASQGGEES
jgi:large subunit ribosomal protein L29